jgi:hypothetical protein
VGSLISSCHLSTGIWLVMMADSAYPPSPNPSETGFFPADYFYFTSERSAALENRGVPHLPIRPFLVEWLQAPVF